MADSPEKMPTMANAGDADSAPEGSATDVADDARAQAKEKPTRSTDDDQYPSGLKMVLLTSAALVVIFLIALDQARGPHSSPHTSQ